MSYLPRNPFPSWEQTRRDECLIVEELCRVIAASGRFQTCLEAWRAILRVRKLAREIREDTILCAGESETGCPAEEMGDAGRD